MSRKMLSLLVGAFLMVGLVAAVSCGGTETVVETVIVEKEVPVEKKVVETVIVEKEIPVEKKVVETVVVEKVVVATATAIPTPTAIPVKPLEPAPKPQNPFGELTVAVTDVGPGTGLHSAQAPVEAMQYWGVGEGLFAVDVDGRVVPKLATDWELAADLSSATISLRDDVVFQKGWGPFTAEDVVWTMNESNGRLNPTSIHGQAGDFAALFGEWTKIDDHKVTFPFITYDLRWNAHFLNEQAQGTAYFSKKAFDEKGEEWMRENIISTGPFQVAEWIQDAHAIIEKVPYDHWYKNPQVSKISFVEVTESATRIAMLRTGEADIAAAIPLKEIPDLAKSGFKAESITRAGRVHQIIFSGNYWEDKHAKTGEPLDRVGAGYCVHDLAWVGCNIPGKQPGDMEEARNVRWALALAIDRDLIVDTVLNGFGRPASLEYVDTSAPYYLARWDIPYDPVRAKELMAATAWPEGNFPIGIWTGGELGGALGTNAEINDAVAGMWAALWPKMQLQVFKSAYSIIRPSLVARSNTIPYGGDCDEGATTIPFDWPHGSTETSLTRGGFGCGIEIPKIAETFLKVSGEPDLAKRTQLNIDLVDYLHDQMILAGTVQVPTFTVYNPNSIAEWKGTPSMFATMNEFESIVPASR